MEFSIRILNEAHSKAVQERLFELGYKWTSANRERYMSIGSLGYINIGYGSGITHGRVNLFNLKTLDDLYTLPKRNILKLNTLEYTLEIVDNQLNVGCQKVSANDAIKAAKFILDNIKEVSTNTSFCSDDIPF